TSIIMHRRKFIQNSALAGIALGSPSILKAAHFKRSFPVVRIPKDKRRYNSTIIDENIKKVQTGVKNEELGWLFHNCFPDTLVTTVFPYVENEKHYTYGITRDIDAMWLRDSSAQVWPYLPFTQKDKHPQELIRGLIRKQRACGNTDTYSNAFYKDPKRTGEWAGDHTDMKPGIHERKWEIASLCYPIRLSYPTGKPPVIRLPLTKNG